MKKQPDTQPTLSKVTFELSELRRIVPSASKLTNGRILPLLGMLKFDCNPDGTGTITGSDGNTWITRKLTGVDCLHPISFMLRAGDLSPVLKLNDNTVDFELDFPTTSAIARWSNGKAKCAIQEIEDYPEPGKLKQDFSFEFPSDLLIGSLKQVHTASCEEKHKPVIQGVNVSAINGAMTFVATDTYRVHVTAHPWDYGDFELTLPPSIVDLILNSDGKNPFQMEWGTDANFVRVEHGDDIIVGSLLAGTYPNWRRVIPPEFSYSLEVESKGLLGSLKRLISCEPTANKVIFTMTENNLNVSGTNLDGRDYDENLPCISNFPDDYRFCLCGPYVVGAISAADSIGVKIENSESTRPISIRDADESGFQAVIMPMTL